MDHLKSKSEFNLDAAKVLIDEHDNFAPSVHCSYYGCFQFIMSKLNQIGITYALISERISASRQNERGRLNSHQYPIDLILVEVEEKSNIYYKRDLKGKIKTLKFFREESDYHNESVNFEKSSAALRLSEEIIKLIKDKL